MHGDGDSGQARQRVFSGFADGAVAAALIVPAGHIGIAPLHQVITVVGLLILCMVSMMACALARGPQQDRIQTLKLSAPPRAPAEEEVMGQGAARPRRGADELKGGRMDAERISRRVPRCVILAVTTDAGSPGIPVETR